MVKTTAAHFSLREQKITLANRPSPGQPITTSPGSVQPLLVIPLHAFIKQAGNRSNSILRLSIKKPRYNSYPPNFPLCHHLQAIAAFGALNGKKVNRLNHGLAIHAARH